MVDEDVRGGCQQRLAPGVISPKLTLTPRDWKSADERATAESSVVHTGV